MVVSPIKIVGAHLIAAERQEDDRGFFARCWCARELALHGLSDRIAQINIGFNKKKGILRGLHYQLSPYQEVKVVRCTRGAIYDVIVDLRRGSVTHKQWAGVELNEQNRRMLYIPEGCAHGYETLADNTEICYQTSEFYAPEYARGVRYDDPAFGIQWPLAVGIVSEADRSWPDYKG